MKRSGDWKGGFTTEPRSRGDEHGENLTTETWRHGESQGAGDRGIARDRVIGGTADVCHDLVIGKTVNICHDLEIRHTASICHPERVGANATASRRIPTAPVPGNATSGSSHETLTLIRRLFYNIWSILRAALREIFDESAYDRFLQRTRAKRSIESYRAFVREREGTMAKRPRCC